MEIESIPMWEQYLAKRGILGAAKQFGWQPNGAGWKYPLYNDAGTATDVHRWKAFDSAANPKYLWPDGKPDWAKYYILPGMQEAISKAAGRAIIASGEPDVLAFRSAGAVNVLCWFGEKAIPATLAEDLKAYGVTKVECYPDLDNAGLIWAQGIVDKLYNTGISVEVSKLPGADGSKLDINKLWINCGFDSDKFWLTLADVDTLHIEPTPDKPLPLLNQKFDELPSGFYDAIEHKLGVTEYKSDGWSKPIRCPMRDHEHDQHAPAAAWHKDKHILSCLKGCGTELLAKDVGEKLGLHWRDYIPQPIPPKVQVVNAPKQAPTGKPKQVYSWNEATEAVINELLGKSAATPEPLPIRWQNLKRFGGLAEMVPAGKMLAIVGDSGDGKTSFIECLIDYWRQNGYSGVLWGPEWSYSEYVYRAIQRYGGPSLMQIISHKKWEMEAQRKIPEDKRHGKRLDTTQIELAIQKANEINKWAGKLYFIQKAGITIEQTVGAASEIISECASRGERIAFGAFDYAQLFETQAASESERTKRALNQVKALIVDRQMVGIVGSQVTKSDGRAAAGGGKNAQHSMQNARSDVFNLMITISREVDHEGNKADTATVLVSKNSLGKNGPTKLHIKGDRLTWHDVELKSFNPPAPPSKSPVQHWSQKSEPQEIPF
jgi:hypothetical protein